jgi:hypothetical protein
MGSPTQAGSEYPFRNDMAISAFCIEKYLMNAHHCGCWVVVGIMQGLQIPNGCQRFTTTRRFTKMLNTIKRRHDPTVTTVSQGVLEWKWNKKTQQIGLDVWAWLDRFYMFG